MNPFTYDHIRALRRQGLLTPTERLAWAWGRVCDVFRIR